MAKRHTQRSNVYHTCAICGTDQPLSHMKWELGKLVCSDNNCVDTAVVGSRDIAVTKAVAIDRKELQPDPKITHPTSPTNDLLDCNY